MPTLFTREGQLYRVVVVFKGSLGTLLGQAAEYGLSVEPAREFPGLGGLLRSCEGVVFLPWKGVVLCGAAEDLAETLEEPGRVESVLLAAGVRLDRTLPGKGPNALPAPEGERP